MLSGFIHNWNELTVTLVEQQQKTVVEVYGKPVRRNGLSYLTTFCRSNQQSFTSLCFCVILAARPGWRFDSWDMLTSSIWQKQGCVLGRDGSCDTHLISNHRTSAAVRGWVNVSPTIIWLAMSRISLSPRPSIILDADMFSR